MQLRIGTDCSGIEAPIQALQQLGIPFKHVFACEIDKYAQKSIQANYNPEILYTDITTRDNTQVPDIDLYVCGFPCQPFSQAGKQLKMNDPRSNIYLYCIDLITVKKPKYIILENVPLFSKTPAFTHLITVLNSLSYTVYYKKLNTKDYGIPQNRQRLYIIAIAEHRLYQRPFQWPEHQELIPLTNYIDTSDIHTDPIPNYAKELINNSQNNIFVNMGFTKNSNKYTFICPCMTTTNQHWCIPLHRKMNINEALALQGFNTNFKQVVSTTQLLKQIGNSMSVNVVKCLIKSLLLY